MLIKKIGFIQRRQSLERFIKFEWSDTEITNAEKVLGTPSLIFDVPVNKNKIL